MRPFFDIVRRHYPKSEEREDLYVQIGWGDVVDKVAFKDTCAVRMSLALGRCGVPLPGASMRGKAGAANGLRIEPRQQKLSDILASIWGKPEVYRSEQNARAGIGQRRGVISFFRIGGEPGGHIDLILPGPHAWAECVRSCFFECSEIWFWSLD